MARQLRIQYPGAVYHVMNRGDRREAVFQGEPDYGGFLHALSEVCRKALWAVHAYLAWLLCQRGKPAHDYADPFMTISLTDPFTN